MAAMSTLHERLVAAIDAEQAIAEAADAEWDHVGVATTGVPAFVAPDAVAEHIAAHDPAMTLRRLAEDRDVLARHGTHFWDGKCDTCYVPHHGRFADWPCPEVRSLARRHGLEVQP
jgi:hypothetical protein